MKKKSLPIDKKAAKLSLSAIWILLFFSNLAFAESLDPYSFNQGRNLQPVLQESFMPAVVRVKKSKDLPNSAPQSPAVVTDRDGSKFIYEDGQLRLKIDEQGNQTYYAKRQPQVERSYEGHLTRVYEYEGAIAKLKNEYGEITGYQEFGQGGLMLKEFDEEKNLIKTHIYNNRLLEWVLDNIDDGRMKYNLEGPEYEEDFEGNMKEYYINSNRKIQQKIEMTIDEKLEFVDGKRTVNDDKGHPLYVLDYKGNKVLTYNYGEHYRLQSTVDQYGNITEYKEDRPILIRNPNFGENAILKIWNWEGTKLISTEDKVTNTTLGLEVGVITYYKNNKPVEARLPDGYVVGRWVYHKGRLIAHWQANRDGTAPHKITLYDHGRDAIIFSWEENNQPTPEELLNWALPKRVISVDGKVIGIFDEETNKMSFLSDIGHITFYQKPLPIPTKTRPRITPPIHQGPLTPDLLT